MKSPLFIQKLSRALQIGLAATALTFLAACASSSWTKQADSALPIEVIHSGSGSIMSFRAHETSDRLYVAGSATAHQLVQPTHVDIQLLDAGGRVLAEQTDDLDLSQHPVTAGGRNGRQPYVASFPLSEARLAAKIRVIYHGSAHGEGNS